MSKEPYSEKNLGLKTGSKKEVFWREIKLKLETNILNAEESLIADRAVLEVAERRIKEEQKL